MSKETIFSKLFQEFRLLSAFYVREANFEPLYRVFFMYGPKVIAYFS